MNTPVRIISILLVSLVIFGCGIINIRNVNLITPSDTIITEERSVENFSKIVMSTFGKVTLTQADSESLTIKGPDNLVPLVKITVRNDVLTIEMEEEVNITEMNSQNMLTFTISLQDLTDLNVSGFAEVEMEALNTSSLNLNMSGAGLINLGQLSAQTLDVDISGLGPIKVAGEVTQLVAEISGAGALEAGDLNCQTAEVNISGLGGATLWVTDTLTGEISGGGSISYYGDPQISFETPGLGNLKPMGNK